MKTNSYFSIGDPDRTRTYYLKIRNLALYPDELRDHVVDSSQKRSATKEPFQAAFKLIPCGCCLRNCVKSLLGIALETRKPWA